MNVYHLFFFVCLLSSLQLFVYSLFIPLHCFQFIFLIIACQFVCFTGVTMILCGNIRRTMTLRSRPFTYLQVAPSLFFLSYFIYLLHSNQPTKTRIHSLLFRFAFVCFCHDNLTKCFFFLFFNF